MRKVKNLLSSLFLSISDKSQMYASDKDIEFMVPSFRVIVPEKDERESGKGIKIARSSMHAISRFSSLTEDGF